MEKVKSFFVGVLVDGDVDKVECWLKRQPEDILTGSSGILVGCKTFVDMPQQKYYVELEHTAKKMYVETVLQYVTDELQAPKAKVFLTDFPKKDAAQVKIPDQLTVRATVGNDHVYVNLLLSDVQIGELGVNGVAIMCQNLRESNGAFYPERTRQEALSKYMYVIANALAKKYDYWEGIDVRWDEVPF